MSDLISVVGAFHDVSKKPWGGNRRAVRALNNLTDQKEWIVETVPIHRLIATQHYVNADFSAAARAARAKKDGLSLPAVVRYEGGLYITDGHHRLFSDSRGGARLAAVRLLDLDAALAPDPWRDLQSDLLLLRDVAFRDEIERRFGSDDAMGVMLVCADGTRYTPAEAGEIYARLGRQAPEMVSEFADGSSAITCTNYAIQVARGFPGRTKIVGFANEDNPTSRVARDEIHPGGHDFALVDDRWLIDPWIRLVASEGQQICFDLKDPTDAAIVRDVYGPAECWSRLPQAEREAACTPPSRPALANALTL